MSSKWQVASGKWQVANLRTCLLANFLWVSTAVLLIAAAFRLVALQDFPPGLSQDEVLNADIASFIIDGYRAIFFREGYGHEPLYHYIAAPFQLLLGDNFLSIRLPAAFLGLLLVALTMRWSKRTFNSTTAITTGLLLAVSWQPVLFSRIGIRPILEPVLLLIMAWFWPRRPYLAGLFLGLTLYSYAGARALFLMPLLWMGYWLINRRPTMRSLAVPSWKAGAKVLITAVIVSLPLFITLWLDPSLQERVGQLSAPIDALKAGDPSLILREAAMTAGVFSFTGDPRWTYAFAGQPLFDWFTATLFYIGLALSFWRWRQPAYAFALIWLAVGMLPSAITPEAPSFIRFIGAMPIIYAFPGIAVHFLGQRVGKWRTPQMGRWVALLLMLALLIVNAGRMIETAGRWRNAELVRMYHYQSTLLEMARYWQDEPTTQLVVADSFFVVDVDTFRRDIGRDPEARWVQFGAGAAGAMVYPADGAGVMENGRLYVPEYAPPPSGLFAQAGIGETPLYRSETHPSFAVYALPSQPPSPPQTAATTFDGAMTLTGYDVVAGNPLELFTYWRVERPLPDDLAIFVHLLNGDGELAAQHDGMDTLAKLLRPGDVLLQRHLLPLPAELSADQLSVRVGLYERGSGRRLLTDNGEEATVIDVISK